MANIKSAKKRVLVIKKKTLHNKMVSSALKTSIKKANAAVASGEDSKEAVRLAIKAVDKAAARGIMHKNTAARKKSALAKKLNVTATNA